MLHLVKGCSEGTNDHHRIHFYCDANKEEGDEHQNDHGQCSSWFLPLNHSIQQTVGISTLVQKVE